MANTRHVRIERTNAQPLGDILRLFVAQNRLGYGLFNMEVFRAWDEASGMAFYSSGKFFREGVFHVTVKSSLVRSQLQFQLDGIVLKMNEILDASETVELSGIQDRVTKIVLH